MLRARYEVMAADGARDATAPMPILPLIGGIADLEDSIGREVVLKAILSRWVIAHIAAALVLYPLLALHVWSGVYYGLRWWR